jgi:16S rRNA (guanine(966)-N(2))-methyltransferase RsmD
MTDLLREAVFNILGQYLDWEGVSVLDLFAGSGSMTWECLSRGAERSTCVELNATNGRFIRATAADFGVAHLVQLVPTRVEVFLQRNTDRYHYAHLDPPYASRTKAALAQQVLAGPTLLPHGVLTLHHPSKEHYHYLPGFVQQRVYGGAAISFFQQPSETPTP